MNKKRVILISGMSGAGKSSAMSVLEDMGYYCVDQFPVQLLPEFIQLIENSNDVRYQYLALATSASDLMAFVTAFKGTELDVRLLFLEASNDVLLRRYKATRRMHPLLIKNVTNTLEEAIHSEREMLLNHKDTAFLTLDTSFFNFQTLKSKIEQYFSKSSAPNFSISFISFGYKHGVPLDADLMFDVRFLPNPYWEEELRALSGDDKPVYDYVINSPETKIFLEKLISFLEYSFERYVNEGKNHFCVAIGCTGGQHRSVSITNYLYAYFSKMYHVYKEHRDKVSVYENK